jgi:hypothetical protein
LEIFLNLKTPRLLLGNIRNNFEESVKRMWTKTRKLLLKGVGADTLNQNQMRRKGKEPESRINERRRSWKHVYATRMLLQPRRNKLSSFQRNKKRRQEEEEVRLRSKRN